MENAHGTTASDVPPSGYPDTDRPVNDRYPRFDTKSRQAASGPKTVIVGLEVGYRVVT